MEENTKASKGASVTKAGTIAGSSSSIGAKGALNQELPTEISDDVEIDGEGEAKDSNAAEPTSAQSTQGKTPSSDKTSGKSGGKRQDHEVIGEQIGRRLRTVYNDMLAQPVPDRFLDLLRELEKDPK